MSMFEYNYLYIYNIEPISIVADNFSLYQSMLLLFHFFACFVLAIICNETWETAQL